MFSLSFGTLILLIFAAGYATLCISGASAILQTKMTIHRILGRKIKWDSYSSFQRAAWFIPGLCFDLVFAWPLIGLVSALTSNFRDAYLAEAAKIIRDFNTFSVEEEQKLDEIVRNFEINHPPDMS